ncbi:MAG TPA: homoserine O-acetyltransferase [Candidatus Kapabacteria bacterium]
MQQYNIQKGSVLLGEPLILESGDVLEEVTIAYETYGELNADRSNVVFVAHALTGSASANQWWSTLIGEGKALDPNEYFIVCANCIGSCYGSTGPSSNSTFPQISIGDIANSTFAFLDVIGIETLSLAIGGSFGGMIVFEMALIAPERVTRIAPLSCGAEHTPWRIAFSSAIRKIIEEGMRSGNTERAFALARQVAMTSYRSSGEFDNRFARKKNSDQRFEVESYLEHQGEKIVGRFSPYSYITLTKAMELYSLFEGRNGTRSEILQRIQQPALLLGATTDMLYPESELISLSKDLPNAEYHSLGAIWGHDSFLIEEEQTNKIVKQFLEKTQ